jgi:hypothetical protein
LDVEPVGGDLYVNVAEDYGFGYLGVLEPYVSSGELSQFLYEEQKKRVLLECIMPLVSGRPQCLELNSLSAFLQYYTNEDYFPPSLSQVMRDLSAPKVVTSKLTTSSSSVSSTPADDLEGQECDQYTGAKPYILSSDVPGKKFVFYTPHYDDNSGGSIAIFKMAHLLNQAGHDARIWHWTRLHANEVRVINGKITKEFLIPSGISRVDIDCPYPIVEATPEDVSDSIVVYPEVIEGNPLGARRVVRWLLNKPGAITGVTSFGFDDLILYYNDQFLPNGVVANEEFMIKVTDWKTNIYRGDYVGERKGIYFMVRKGRDVPLNYHPKDAIQVDGLSHAELAGIFSVAKMFISYDLYTAYSTYASLCGCDSVLVPRRGMSREQWKSSGNHSHLDGIAYGFEDIERARRTRGKMIARIEAGNSENMLAVEKFVRACRLLN